MAKKPKRLSARKQKRQDEAEKAKASARKKRAAPPSAEVAESDSSSEATTTTLADAIREMKRRREEAKTDSSEPLEEGLGNEGVGKVANNILMKEMIGLSIDAEYADAKEAKEIIEKIKRLKEVAKATLGERSDTFKELIRSTVPIEKSLKDKASFHRAIRAKLKDKLRRLPEAIVAKIPIIGGLLSRQMEKTRVRAERGEDYEQSLRRRISMREGGALGRGRIPSPTEPSGDQRGGDSTEESSTEKEERGGGSPNKITKLLSTTLDEIREIKKILLKMEKGGTGGTPGASKENAKETKTLTKRLTDWLKETKIGKATREFIGRQRDKALVFGKKTLPKKTSKAMDWLKEKARRGYRRTRVSLKKIARKSPIIKGVKKLKDKIKRSRPYRKTRILAKKAWRKTKDVAKKLFRKGAPKIGGKPMSSATGGGKGLGGRIGGAIRGMLGGGAAGAGGGGWLSGGLGLLSKGWKAVSGAASMLNPKKLLTEQIPKVFPKLAKGLKAIPAVGSIISAGLGVLDIASIVKNPKMSKEEKKEAIGKRLGGLLGSAIGSAAGGLLGSIVPGLGTIIGTIGGSMLGDWLGEIIATAIGPKKIYDLVASLPIVGPMLSLDDSADKEKTGAGTAGAADAGGKGGAATGAGVAGAAGTDSTGTLSKPPTASTTVGTALSNYKTEMDSLNATKASAASPPPSSVNNSSVKNNVNTNINNYNDDLRLRNSEPTIGRMQTRSAEFI